MSGAPEAGDAAAVGGDISDISNSPAYTFLDDLQQAGKLTPAQVELYKSKYAKLYEVVLATYENEKNLLKKAKALNQELLAERVKLEKAGVRSAEDGASIVKLRGELAKAEGELAICEEREQMLRLEQQELNRLKTEAEGDLAAKRKAYAEMLEPQINAINAQIDEVKKDTEKLRQAGVKLGKEQQEANQRIEQLGQHKAQLAEERAESLDLLTKLRTEPEKIKKQADVVATAYQNLQIEANKAMNEVKGSEENILAGLKRIRELEAAIDDQKNVNAKVSKEISKKFEELTEIEAAVQKRQEDNNTLIGDRVKQDFDIRSLLSEAKRETEALLRAHKERDNALRKLKKAEVALEAAKDQVPVMERTKADAQRRLEITRADRKGQVAQLEELKREVDIYINNFLKQENLEKDKAEQLTKVLVEIRDLEAEVAALAIQEHGLSRELAELSSHREIRAREAARATARYRETKEEIKVKELVIMDLGKKNAETAQRLKEFSQLYEMVKNERNKYVNLIQAAAQALAEMREKVKILQNEIEILRNESLSKDKALAKERLEHQNSFTARDALRAEFNKHMYTYKQKQEQVEQQIAEIDKLNSVINAAEKEMVRLKKMYEMGVEDRNYTGIQLIDRNDELCILYEKANIQEGILKRGETELRRREEEIRMLRLEVAGLQRKIAITRKLLPKIPELEEQVMACQLQLHEAREQSELLSYQLENAENKARWRKLGGRDPQPEELAAKIRQLEERLNDKKEQLLEKELVLEEVSTLSDRLRREAADGRLDTLELAKKVNEFQAKIKTMTKRMMATVSELSMHQATAMKLQQEKHDREISVEEARWRLDNGQPPTEDAEREWYRMERDRMLRREAALRKQEEAALLGAAEGDAMVPTHVTRTTAEPRPNAYIPDEIGIPKPYGSQAPFKPSDLAAQGRYYRKPQAREIII
eukprot:tig00000836_g4705.t1